MTAVMIRSVRNFQPGTDVRPRVRCLTSLASSAHPKSRESNMHAPVRGRRGTVREDIQEAHECKV